jgi:hypothetical protein
MISKRTSLSLAQYLEIHDQDFLKIILEKHDFKFDDISYPTRPGRSSSLDLKKIAGLLCAATQEQLYALLCEIVRTSNDLRARMEHAFREDEYRHDDRFNDLKQCLLLDGYNVKNGEVIPHDPTILDTPSVDDDLTMALRSCKLADANEIIQKLNESADSFRQAKPNFNASLNDARIALQTLAKSIAMVRREQHAGNFEEKKWGSVLAYLRGSDFITEDEEKGLAGVFGFVSPGSHRSLGLSEMEMARLGRSFVLGMCWFLVRRFASET